MPKTYVNLLQVKLNHFGTVLRKLDDALFALLPAFFHRSCEEKRSMTKKVRVDVKVFRVSHCIYSKSNDLAESVVSSERIIVNARSKTYPSRFSAETSTLVFAIVFGGPLRLW